MSKNRSALRNQVEFAAFRMARGLAGLLSPTGLAKVGDVVGNFYATLPGRRRQIIDFNLRLAFPDMTDDERRTLAYAVTRHFARSALDAIRLQRLRPEELLASVDVDGWGNVERAMSPGRGAFFLTAHIGSWEVAALVTGLKVEAGLSVVNRPLDNPLLELELDRLRKLYGNHVFGKHNIVREVLAQLKKGGGVGILIDQRVREIRASKCPSSAPRPGPPAFSPAWLERPERRWCRPSPCATNRGTTAYATKSPWWWMIFRTASSRMCR